MPRFSLSIFVLVISFHWVQAQTAPGYLAEFAQKWSNTMDYTLELAELMPDSLYAYQPTPDTRTFAQQFVHSLRNMTWLNERFLGGEAVDIDFSNDSYSKEELQGMAENCFEHCARHVATLRESELDDPVDGFFAGPMTKRQILTLMNDHLTHHRGQMIVYLRLNGIEPSKYRGW